MNNPETVKVSFLCDHHSPKTLDEQAPPSPKTVVVAF